MNQLDISTTLPPIHISIQPDYKIDAYTIIIGTRYMFSH